MKYDNEEFFDIIKPIIGNSEFQKLKNIKHHGITRYDHCLRVAYFSYKVTKALKLDYIEVTEAALLHDFFFDEADSEDSLKILKNHPNIAVENAKKYFFLTDKQQDIIEKHMFPIGLKPPLYLESWVVDIVDDVAAIYEKTKSTKKEIQAAITFLMLIVINFIKYR